MKRAHNFNRGTEKNCGKGLVTGVGRIPGEAVPVITETNGGSYFFLEEVTRSIENRILVILLLFHE